MARKSEAAVVGQYRLGQIIGEGGQGKVYRARHIKTSEIVALKMISVGAESARRRLVRELAALRKLSHNNIVRLLDTVEHSDGPNDPRAAVWVAYEFVNGVPLSERIRDATGDTSEVASLIAPLADGLQCAHDSGVVHRDLKPDNIILRGRKWQEPVLIDFGYAKVDGASRMTRTRGAPGTLRYMPPESLADAKLVSPQSDQWSLAVVLTEALASACGVAPADFGGTLGGEYAEQLLEEIEGELSQTAAVLRRALAAVPDLRYASVKEFSDAMLVALTADGVTRDTTGPDDDAEPDPISPDALGRLRASLARHVGVSLSSQRGATDDVFFAPDEEDYWSNAQLAIWRTDSRDLRVGVIARSRRATRRLRKALADSEPFAAWAREAKRHVGFAVFDRQRLSSAEFERLPSARATTTPATQLFAGRNIGKGTAIAFARSAVLTETEIEELARGRLEPVEPVLGLWRLLLSVQE